MEAIVLASIGNIIITVAIGFAVFNMLKSKDKKIDWIQMERDAYKFYNKKEAEAHDKLQDKYREVSKKLWEEQKKSSKLQIRLDGCNAAYNKVMDMNAHQENIINDLKKWKRGRDPFTGKFKPKNK